jgi:hypothetical protein
MDLKGGKAGAGGGVTYPPPKKNFQRKLVNKNAIKPKMAYPRAPCYAILSKKHGSSPVSKSFIYPSPLSFSTVCKYEKVSGA